MRREEFLTWLLTRGLKKSTASSRVANCATVEKYEGDLDSLFERGKLSVLIEKFVYSKKNSQAHIPAKHSIPICGNIYEGTATLRRAIHLYKQFLEARMENQNLQVVNANIERGYLDQRVEIFDNWPDWGYPDDDKMLSIVKVVTPYIRFLHQDIIHAVVEDNERHKASWCKKLAERGVCPDFYLWKKSSCVFPGIRRHVGASEQAYFHKKSGDTDIKIPGALALDDNHYPKHIWAYLFTGKKFQNKGPVGYSLAHLADHKEYKNRWTDEFESTSGFPKNLHGLFSCASNTAYSPTNTLKLTDFNSKVRLLLLNKAQDLYGTVCNLLPPELQIKQEHSEKWHFEQFEWSPPVGSVATLDGFFEFRADKIESL